MKANQKPKAKPKPVKPEGMKYSKEDLRDAARHMKAHGG